MVHRDVACRNILLTEGKVANQLNAKLADFGLCCYCDDTFTYHAITTNRRLPLKWLSIEALTERLFSEKSDVWAFGILCYEIFSFGKVPYLALSNYEIVEFLQAGNRLEKPNDTPDAIYELMLDCWRENPADRSKFKDIANSLKTMLENETTRYGYLKLGSDD
uniref:Protein kinase domain-containing protein n=1 Tax=Panagrolaimus davidi TaxID=227884 RepID=A0A914QK37_9BILA